MRTAWLQWTAFFRSTVPFQTMAIDRLIFRFYGDQLHYTDA